VVSFSLCSTAVVLSLSTQNKISIIKNEIVKKVSETNEPIQFTTFKSNKRIESLTSQYILSSLRGNFYSYALATRLFDENFYLSANLGEDVLTQDINLLESAERPYDSPNYILHGDLNIAYSEPVRVGNFTTNYGYLSSEQDSIYISEELGNIFSKQERLALAKQELASVKTEHEYFIDYFNSTVGKDEVTAFRKKLKSNQLMTFLQECQSIADSEKKLSFFSIFFSAKQISPFQ
jgi:hypothetical protein